MANVPIQSLIDHIKTAIDVDPWAKEMAEELLKEQEPKLVDNIQIRTLDTVGDCPSCGIGVSKRYHPMHCGLCGQAVKWYE